MWPFGEENLYEAIAETYLPLLNAIDELREEGIAAKLTVGITPVLAEQLADEHLKQGYEAYVEAILARVDADRHRYSEAGERERWQWEAAERRTQRLKELEAAYDALQAAAAEAVDAEAASDEAVTDGAEAILGEDAVLEAAQTSTQVVAASLGATRAIAAQDVTDVEALAGATDADALGSEAPVSQRPTLADVPEEEQPSEWPQDPRRELSQFYYDWYAARLADFRVRYGRDILGAFRRLQDAGCIEIITCAATHGFSPLLSRDSSLNAQFKVGADTYERHFGRRARGVWLPECAYRPGVNQDTLEGYIARPAVDQFLYENQLQYFFTDAHAVVGGKTSGMRRHIGVYGKIEYIPMPEKPLSGLTTYHGYWLPENPVAVYARNERAGYQVWSADQGYPGDFWYREFHKKDGNSGMPYWRITGDRCDLVDKDFYNPAMAAQRVEENSDHYVRLIAELLSEYEKAQGEPGLVVVPFDTELFGHWWFEGVSWIKQVIKKMAQQGLVDRLTVGEIHEQMPPEHAYALPESTWGAGGHYHVWLNPDVEFMWPIIHRCEARMEALVEHRPTPVSPLERRALQQAARELLLLEGSDWPFLVTTGQAKVYAIDRFNEHVARFDELADAILSDSVSEELVAGIEAIDNLFPDIDPYVFKARQGRFIASTHPAESTNPA
jgi:1,4-alpha-glucan branching enzyme